MTGSQPYVALCRPRPSAVRVLHRNARRRRTARGSFSPSVCYPFFTVIGMRKCFSRRSWLKYRCLPKEICKRGQYFTLYSTAFSARRDPQQNPPASPLPFFFTDFVRDHELFAHVRSLAMGKKRAQEPEEREEESEEEEDYEEEGGGGSMGDGSDGGDDADMGDSEVDEEELEMEKAALLSKAHAKTPKINKQADIMERLGDIVLGGGKKVPWAELFYVSSRVPAESIVEDVDDDLKREVRAGVRCARARTRAVAGADGVLHAGACSTPSARVSASCTARSAGAGPLCLTRALCPSCRGGGSLVCSSPSTTLRLRASRTARRCAKPQASPMSAQKTITRRW